MQAYGRKKTRKTAEGHQECGTCHPVQKSKRQRARREAKREIKLALEAQADRAAAS